MNPSRPPSPGPGQPPPRSVASAAHAASAASAAGPSWSEIELVARPDLVPFSRGAPIVLLLIGNSTARATCLVPVAHHFGRRYPRRVRVGCAGLSDPADRAWALGLVRTAFRDPVVAPVAVLNGAYLFLQGEALGYHEGPYAPVFDPLLRQVQELRDGRSSASLVSRRSQAAVAPPESSGASGVSASASSHARRRHEAQQRLNRQVIESARQVTQHFEGLLSALRAVGRRKTPQEILQLPPRPTLDQIKSAYRRLIREHHPDLAAGDEVAQRAARERSQEIIQAYESLLRRMSRR